MYVGESLRTKNPNNWYNKAKDLHPFPQNLTLSLLFDTDGRESSLHFYLTDSQDSLQEGQHGPQMLVWYLLFLGSVKGAHVTVVFSLYYIL